MKSESKMSSYPLPTLHNSGSDENQKMLILAAWMSFSAALNDACTHINVAVNGESELITFQYRQSTHLEGFSRLLLLLLLFWTSCRPHHFPSLQMQGIIIGRTFGIWSTGPVKKENWKLYRKGGEHLESVKVEKSLQVKPGQFNLNCLKFKIRFS